MLPHQRQALARAGEALDHARPHAAHDLASAFRRDPALIGDAASGRSAATIRAMALEAEVRTNPQLRADRFVERWQGLERMRGQLDRAGDEAGADKLGKRMENLAGALHRDPQLESILRNRTHELGLASRGGSSIAHELTRSLRIERDMGLSL